MTAQGLTDTQAKELLAKYGLNELPQKGRINQLKLFLNQFKSILVLLLVVASALSFVAGDMVDGILILIILLLNVSLGFWQEYKASKELEALRKLEVSNSRVIRDGVQIEIPSNELVPGDIIVLESGDKIPADAILLESHDLSVNQSALTGESLPVIKSTDPKDYEIYFGTIVVAGKALAQVTLTGKETRFGKIALMLSEVVEELTPLEVSLNKLAQNLGIIAVVIAIFVFAVRIMQGFDILEMFFTSTAIMVAAVPEGLPTVITIALAIGVRRMYQKKVLVRKLNAIESLGATSVICSDKTGTITKNEMTVKQVVGLPINREELIKTAVICNNASLVMKENPPAGRAGHGGFDILGDTTEGALLVWAKQQGIDPESIKSKGKIVDEMPFDLKKRMMAVIFEEDSKHTIYVKGAPEVVIPLCELSEKEQKKLLLENEKLAKLGLRVLALAQKPLSKVSEIEEGLKDLKFLGLIGIADAPRDEAAQTIARAKLAGIRIVMVTGDNELTAKAIAEEVGLLEQGDEILIGSQLEELSDAELDAQIKRIRVFARVFPEQKLRIIKSYQRLGEIVAVTGDGVNDALALKQAHVGVAMGTTGTDVAKEASDIVILDDNLATILASIEQGRLIYSNILKVVKFLLTGNLSEVLLIVGAIALGFPTPLLPVQILWINFVTDGLPALALTGDSASKNIMRLSPRDPSETLLNKETVKFILSFGLIIAALTLVIFWYFFQNFNLEIARSYAFSVIVILQMIMIFIMRRHHSVFSNKYLFLAVASVLVIQGFILYYPPLQEIFKTNSGF